MHVEGPFIHPEDGPRGAHPLPHVLAPTVPHFERLYQACRGRMRILTLAPERPGALEVIRAASERGVVVALGHHRADERSIALAVEAGARMCTHLGNGSDAQLPRNNNYIWWQLAEDRLWATFITDGHHLPPATVKVALRAKGLDRSVLITDAISAAGMPPGRFPLGDSEVVKTPEGRVCLPGTPYLAGSAAEMPEVVANAVTQAGIPLVDALRLGSIQPATLVPGDLDPWSIEVGRRANLAAWDWNRSTARLSVRQAVIARFAVRMA
jgi:N-acetylglucosamine-6-phosphate deacetylase